MLVFLALFQGLVRLLLAWSMKFVQKASLIHFITWCVLQPMSWDKYTVINDVIDELVHCLLLKTPSRDHSVCVWTYLSFSIFSWIVDVYIQVPWPHCAVSYYRSNLDSTSSSSSWHSLFQVLQTPLCLFLQHGDVCCLHVGCDVKIHLWHASCEKIYQTFCTNFVLQTTNTQCLEA